MLDVAIIIERAEIGLGGAERSVSELTAELQKQGVEATILAAKGTAAENVRILCEDVPGKRVSLKTFEQAIGKHLILEQEYDLIHSTLPLAGADIYQPRGGSYKEAMLQNIASYPFAFNRFLKRRTHFLNTRRTEYLKAEETLCRHSQATIAALSDYVKRQFIQHYGLDERRIAVVPNGINPAMQPDETSMAAIRATIHKNVSVPHGKEPVLFLFAANNPRLKGFRTLMYALKQTTEQTHVHPVLLVAGTLKAGYYKRLIGQFGLQNHVVQLGKLNGIANALSVCDAAVLPSYYDPCSRFILEALAMGKPAITTRFNGASERYAHLRHGFIVDDPNDWRSLADGLLYFCDRAKIELAREAIMDDNLADEVSIAKHAEKLIGLYETIITQRKKS